MLYFIHQDEKNKLEEEKAKFEENLNTLQEELNTVLKTNQSLSIEVETLKKKDEIFENEIARRQINLHQELNRVNEEFNVSNEENLQAQRESNPKNKGCRTPTCNGLGHIDGVTHSHKT